MSTTIEYYCSCSTCTQVRNEQPKHYRYLNSFRYFLTCSSCVPKTKLPIENSQTFSSLNNSRTSTITFRNTDITNKHCSKHDVLIKASRPNFSKNKTEQLRQRVKDANQRWTRMSILPSNLIDFIFKNKDFIPLCTICYENLSLSIFNLCHTCITTLINYQRTPTLTTIPNPTILNHNDEVFLDDIENDVFS
jgi:hypothetical protein